MKKLIAMAAASALMLGSTAAMAQSSASKLSLSNAPAKTTAVRAKTAAKKSNDIVASPLLIIGVIIGAVVALELTGAIDIISDSP